MRERIALSQAVMRQGEAGPLRGGSVTGRRLLLRRRRTGIAGIRPEGAAASQKAYFMHLHLSRDLA